MRKEAKVGHRVGDFLNGKSTLSVELLARSKCVRGGVEKLDDLGIVHQSEFSATRSKKLWQLSHECFVVASNF